MYNVPLRDQGARAAAAEAGMACETPSQVAALAKEKEEQKKAAEVCTQPTPVPLVVGKPGV